MDDSNKIKIIERFDSYYSGINNKGAFILAINSLIISGFLIGFKSLLSLIPCSDLTFFKSLIAIILLITLISMLLTILAIIPYLTSSKNSFWFFNDVANMTKETFIKNVDEQTNESLRSDLNEQIFYLARGLKRKHLKIRYALALNMIQILLTGIAGYLIILR